MYELLEIEYVQISLVEAEGIENVHFRVLTYGLEVLSRLALCDPAA